MYIPLRKVYLFKHTNTKYKYIFLTTTSYVKTFFNIIKIWLLINDFESPCDIVSYPWFNLGWMGIYPRLYNIHGIRPAENPGTSLIGSGLQIYFPCKPYTYVPCPIIGVIHYQTIPFAHLMYCNFTFNPFWYHVIYPRLK